MGVESLGFSNGLVSGANSAMSILDRIDAKKSREKSAARQDVLFDQSQTDRVQRLKEHGVDRQHVLDERDYSKDRRGVLDGRSDVAYADGRQDRQHVLSERDYSKDRRGVLDGRQDTAYADGRQDRQHVLSERDYSKDRRGVLDGRQDNLYGLKYESARFNLNGLKNKELRDKALQKRADQSYNMEQAQRIYSAALVAESSGDTAKADQLLAQADKMAGGLYSNMATGVHANMAKLSEEVSTGQRSLDDAEFVAVSKQYMQPTMKNTGRDGKFEYGGLQALPDGRFTHTLRAKEGSYQTLSSFVKKTEKYSRKPYWDHKQWTNGYGTKAKSKNEVISKEEAQKRFDQHLQGNVKKVEQFVPKDTPKGIVNALASLTYNSGTKWMNSGLGEAVKQKDWKGAEQKFLQYVNASGKQQKGLVKRRKAEAQWFHEGRTVPATAAQSSHPEDQIIARPRQEMVQEVQMGATAEREVMGGTTERMKQILVGMAYTSGKLPKASASEDSFMKVDGGVFNKTTKKFLPNSIKKTAKVAAPNWEINPNDGSYYNSKALENPSGASDSVSPINISTLSVMPPQQQNIALLPQIRVQDRNQQAQILKDLGGLGDLGEKLEYVDKQNREVMRKDITADLTGQVDIEGDDPVSHAMTAVKNEMVKAGIPSADIGKIVSEVMDNQMNLDDAPDLMRRLIDEVNNWKENKKRTDAMVKRARNTPDPTRLYGSGAH